jgi:hypothetical protein
MGLADQGRQPADQRTDRMTDRLSREDLQAGNIAKAPEYFTFAADFYLLAHEYIDATEHLHGAQANFAIGLAILARGTNSLQGAVVLSEVGLTLEANSLVRAGIECCFALGAMGAGHPLLDRLRAAHHHERDKWGRFQLQNRGASALDPDQLERIEKQIAETPKGKRIQIKDLADAAGLTEYYDSMYRPLSNFGTHLSEGSLSLLQEPIENDADHIVMAIHGVVSTFALLLREVEKQFPVPHLEIELEKTIHAYADFVDPKPSKA